VDDKAEFEKLSKGGRSHELLFRREKADCKNAVLGYMVAPRNRGKDEDKGKEDPGMKRRSSNKALEKGRGGEE